MMLLAAARDLMIVFLGIELMSIAVYALAGMNRRSERSAEGALKYFLLGAFSTAFLLYGIALVYGATGTTTCTLIGERIGAVRSDVAARCCSIGIALLLIGFGFKVATRAVPHVGAGRLRRRADADHGVHGGDGEGGGVRRVPPRLARGVPGELRARGTPRSGGSRSPRWSSATSIALAQKNLKRMLAYSSIAHAGYLLVALAAGHALRARSALLFYLFAYTLATFGAFARRRCARAQAGERIVDVDDLRRALDRAPVARRRDGGVHARAARLPDLRRRGILREVVRAPGGAPVAATADDARRRPRAHDRRLGGLLPVRRHGDVHAAAPVQVRPLR